MSNKENVQHVTYSADYRDRLLLIEPTQEIPSIKQQLEKSRESYEENQVVLEKYFSNDETLKMIYRRTFLNLLKIKLKNIQREKTVKKK